MPYLSISAFGDISFEGKIKANGEPLKIAVNGSGKLGNFNVFDPKSTQDLLRWKKLDISDLNFVNEPLRVDIRTISLSDFFARMMILPDGSFNLKQIVRQDVPLEPQAIVASAAPATTQQPVQAKKDTPVHIDKIILQQGNINFSDQFIKPNYRANLTKLAGQIGPLYPGKPGKIDVHGMVVTREARTIVCGVEGENPPALFVVDTRLSPEGVLLAHDAPHKLTRSQGIEETMPVVHGKRLATALLESGAFISVQLVDLEREPPQTGPRWTATARTQNAITNLQETGQMSGVGRRMFRLSPPVARVSLAFEGGALVVRAEGKEARVPEVLPPSGVDAGTEWLKPEPHEKGQLGNLVTWAVDRVRASSLVGDDNMQKVKEAESLAQTLGPGYMIKYGEHAPGSSEFDFANSPASPTICEEALMAFIVNSSPGAGLRCEPSATLPDASAALGWAAGLERRGMRLIRIRDTVSGAVFDQRSLRDEIKRLQAIG